MKAPLVLVFLLLVSCFGCRTQVEEKEFIEQFKKLSDSRMRFRLNMKALGDSNFSHHDYAKKALTEIWKDSAFEKRIELNYKAYCDSLIVEMKTANAYFSQQWAANKPLISNWEKSDMKYDNLIQSMKVGDISEENGLDSLKDCSKNLDQYIAKSDSLVKQSTAKYWAFRKTFEEFKYNLKNLKYLYASKLEK